MVIVQQDRVIDLIAALSNHDPVAPVEVWCVGPDADHYTRRKFTLVRQITPTLMKDFGQPYDASVPQGPLPVAIFLEPETSPDE